MSRRRPQLELWGPGEQQVTHLRCPECLGIYRVDRGCTWCASGSHALAEAVRFASGWLVAQFPEKIRTMPRASVSTTIPPLPQ